MKPWFWLGMWVIAVMLGGGRPAAAQTTIGGIIFTEQSFADAVTVNNGSFATSGGTVGEVLTGSNLADHAFSFSTGAAITLHFLNNVVWNGDGADLAIFEKGTEDGFTIRINNITRAYYPTDTGVRAGGSQVNWKLINLDDFEIPWGSYAAEVRVGMERLPDSGHEPALTGAAAIYNSQPVADSATAVPEPCSLLLFLPALAVVGALKRRCGA